MARVEMTYASTDDTRDRTAAVRESDDGDVAAPRRAGARTNLARACVACVALVAVVGTSRGIAWGGSAVNSMSSTMTPRGVGSARVDVPGLGCGKLDVGCWIKEANRAFNRVRDLEGEVNRFRDQVNGLTNQANEYLSQVNRLTGEVNSLTNQARDQANIANGYLSQVNRLTDYVDDVVDIVESLPNKLKELVGFIWEPWLDVNANLLLDLIQDALTDVTNGFSATSALGSARGNEGADRAAFLALMRENLSRVFAGKELIKEPLETSDEDLHSTASLGGRRGFCHEIPIQLWEDVESPTPLMPWPDKFASDMISPNSFHLRCPKLVISLCQTLDKFEVPSQVAVKIIQAFLKMFDNMFNAIYEASGVKEVITEIENFGKQINGRKLLGDDARALQAELKRQLSEKESVFYQELIVLHQVFTSTDGFKTEITSQLGVASARARGEAAALGGSTFKDVFDNLRSDLIAAMREMKDLRMQVSTTLKYSFSLGFEVTHVLFREGELISEFFNRDEALTGTKVQQIVPGLFVALDYEMDLRLPYYFRAEVQGKFDFEVEVEFPVTISFGGSQGQNFVKFGNPRVNAGSPLSGRGVAGLQIGVVAMLSHAYMALCAGPVCAGPEVEARQDVYVGFDAFAQVQQSGATCHAGPESLTAMWSNWDYGSKTKETCTRSQLGAGAYLQIPKTKVGAKIALKPLPTEVEPPAGMAPVATLFEFAGLIDAAYSSDGFFLQKELFHACTAPQKTNLPVCNPACQFTKAQPMLIPAAQDLELKSLIVGLNADLKVPVDAIALRTARFRLTNDWVDTGITDLESGSYVVEVYDISTNANGGGIWRESYTGLMTWYSPGTNGNQASEINLHASGHAANGQYVLLRTLEVGQGVLRLQAKLNSGTTNSNGQYALKFRRIIPDPQQAPPIGGIAPKNEMDDLSYFPVSVSTAPNSWVDTGIHGDALFTGSYFVQIAGVSTFANGGNLWHITYTGLMSWYASVTNSEDVHEIVLHASGHAQNGGFVKLRTIRSGHTAGTNLRLQLLTNENLQTEQTFHFWFRRVFPAQTGSSMSIPSNVLGTAVDGVTLLELKLTLTTSWQNIWGLNHKLDIAGDSAGSFVVQILPMYTAPCGGGLWDELATGIISWYDGVTNDVNENAVRLHQAGHASNGNFFELKTIRTPGSAGMDMFFQIRSTAYSATCESTFKFAFRRLL